MAKLTKEERIEIYTKRKMGVTIPRLVLEYGICERGIEYLVRLLDMHGPKVLKNGKNRYYSLEFKETVIQRV